MVPHAGYVYSGGVAGRVFSDVHIPKTVVVLCPNHTGAGNRVAVASHEAFAIPGATIPVNRTLADELVRRFEPAVADAAAHQYEHAIEVELPFLLARQPDLEIVPVVQGPMSVDEATEMGRVLADLHKESPDGFLVVASSDMSHFLDDDETRKVDQVALAPLLAFDPEGLYQTVRDQGISMCGYIPATTMLSFARELGSKSPELLDYATSGDAFGDRSRVVGYAGVSLAR
jgi:AmmeMemoRadiSam system protein B